MRQLAIENSVTTFTSLDTVSALGAMVLQIHPRRLHGLVEGVGQPVVIPDCFPGGLHFRREVGVQPAELAEGEHGDLAVPPFFLRVGFNIEATTGTAQFLKEQGIRTRMKKDYTEDPSDITAAMRGGKVAYLVNTRDPNSVAQQV